MTPVQAADSQGVPSPALAIETPPSLFGQLKQVSDAELARYAELIYQRTGIRVAPQKKVLLSNRLRRRLRETGIEDFSAYYRHLTRLPASDPEWDAFLQEITTHETFLFRDESQWDWFRREFLREVASRAWAGSSGRRLRIWSAACSTGDEPVTIACCVAACLPNFGEWQIQILGTDIGLGALEQAQAGVFGERAMHRVPEDYRRRFFVKARGANVWQARPVLMGMVRFRQHNLMHPLREPPFDVVFVKNVLIYFDAASKRTAMKHISAVIRPGGYLVTGAAEGVADLVQGFVRLQPWLHRRRGSDPCP